jgi:hypothetical protein
MTSPAPGGPSNVGTKDKQTTCTMRGSVAEMTLQVAPILRDWGRVAFLRHVVFVTVLYAALIEPEREGLERAESAPTGAASTRTGIRAIAVLPLRARNRLPAQSTHPSEPQNTVAKADSWHSRKGPNY